MGKTIICHCEDISLGELLSAIEQGYTDIESVKRYTGIATGPCQGKCCLIQTLRVLLSYPDMTATETGGGSNRGDATSAARLGGAQLEAKLPTIRQPVLPMRIEDIREGDK
jgi:bacterioferritin-associated ferredoxin